MIKLEAPVSEWPLITPICHNRAQKQSKAKITAFKIYAYIKAPDSQGLCVFEGEERDVRPKWDPSYVIYLYLWVKVIELIYAETSSQCGTGSRTTNNITSPRFASMHQDSPGSEPGKSSTYGTFLIVTAYLI